MHLKELGERFDTESFIAHHRICAIREAGHLEKQSHTGCVVVRGLSMHAARRPITTAPKP